MISMVVTGFFAQCIRTRCTVYLKKLNLQQKESTYELDILKALQSHWWLVTCTTTQTLQFDNPIYCTAHADCTHLQLFPMAKALEACQKRPIDKHSQSSFPFPWHMRYVLFHDLYFVSVILLSMQWQLTDRFKFACKLVIQMGGIGAGSKIIDFSCSWELFYNLSVVVKLRWTDQWDRTLTVMPTVTSSRHWLMVTVSVGTHVNNKHHYCNTAWYTVLHIYVMLIHLPCSINHSNMFDDIANTNQLPVLIASNMHSIKLEVRENENDNDLWGSSHAMM